MSKTNDHSVSLDTKTAKKSADKKREEKVAQPSDLRKRIAEIKQVHRQEIQALRSRYGTEQKLLREGLKAQRLHAKEAAEASQKVYDSELKQLRTEYNNQNESLKKELKQYLENSVREITTSYESRITKENDQRIDGLKNMIHDDFLKAMQEKQEEIDQIRLQSNDEIAKLVQENGEKMHRIAQLESKMKQVSHYLPEDIQEELAEQFGFEADLDTLEESKPTRRGLLARITSFL